MASMDEKAPTRWQLFKHKEKLPDLPKGVEPILPHVKAPKELHDALSQIGYVANRNEAEQYVGALKTGQSLVSADGSYWRWDGYCVEAEATDHHALRLEQKNKLAELDKSRAAFEKKLDDAQKASDKAQEAHKKAKAEHETVLTTIKETESGLSELRPALLQIKEKSLKIQSEKNRYDDQVKTLEEDIATYTDTLSRDQLMYDSLVEAQHNDDQNEDAILETKDQLDYKKEEFQEALRDFDRLEQSAARVRRVFRRLPMNGYLCRTALSVRPNSSRI